MEVVLANYQPSLIALTLLVIIVLAQNILAAVIKINKAGQAPGIQAMGNNSDFPFRVYRTHMNSVENFSTFAACIFLAVIAGTNPKWINILAIVHVTARVGFWLVYYSGAGALVGGPRTLIFALGWFTNLGLALLILISLI